MLDEIANNLWMYIYIDEQEDSNGWMFQALNHPAGNLAEYWLQSIARWRDLQEIPPKTMSPNHHIALSKIMENDELPGTLARVVFTSVLPFLSIVDENWVDCNLIPLLYTDSEDFEPAWDGISYCGQIFPQTIKILREPCFKALEKISKTTHAGLRQRFARIYTNLLTWFAKSPDDEWIIQIFEYRNTEIRHLFANNIQNILRVSDESKQKELWDTWLKGYWDNRLSGYPIQLEDEEIKIMLDWTIEMEGVYPEAIDLAVRMPPVYQGERGAIDRLTNSNLPTKHPESVAKFLIRIGETIHFPWTQNEADKLIDSLLKSSISSETESKLKELKVNIETHRIDGIHRASI